MATTEELLNMVDERISKSVFISSDLTSGGLLNPEQANQFIEKVIDYAAILPDVRTVKMAAPKRLIEKINFTSRVMVAPGAEGTEPSSTDTKKPTLQKVTLDTKEIAAYVDLGFDTIEDNIEHAGFEDHIVNLITSRVALDLEELYLTGDTGSGDPFLALLDGWLKQSTSHVVDNMSATFSEDTVFGPMIDALPVKYFRVPSDYKLYVNPVLAYKIRRERAARATIGGDTWLTGAVPLTYQGVPIVPVPLMPQTASALGNVLLIHPQNIVVGIHRDINYDRFRHGRKRVVQMTWTMRVDTKYEEEDAVVKAINVA